MTSLLAAAVILASQQVHRESTEWTNTWITNAHKNDKPRVLLVGDSIAQAYYNGVSQSLKEEAYVARITTSRSVCDPLFLRELEIVLDQYKFKVIHFNNGLHGVPYSIAEYTRALEGWLDFLKRKCPDSRLIWADSTPLKRTGPLNSQNKTMDERNAAASAIMIKADIPINSLSELMADHDELHTDNHHWNGQAIKMQADQTAAFIKKALQ